MNDDYLIDDTLLDEPPHHLLQEGSEPDQLLPSTYRTSPQTTNPWDPRLLLDLAISVEPLAHILPRYGLDEHAYALLLDNQLFRKELAMMMRDVQENGATFKAKSRIQAEGYLPVIDELIYSQETPSSIRLQAIQSVVKWGDLEPRPSAQASEGPASTITVQINF